MNGLELARAFYGHCRPMLAESIPDLLPHLAIGLVGEGSECFGCDDAFSRDHDFGPGFCLWLDDDLLMAQQARLDAALACLPAVFMGLPTRVAEPGRTGPMGEKAFYGRLTGLDHAPETWEEWLALPEERVAAATNGEVFEDMPGTFSAWRRSLLDFYPLDIWLKKLCARVMNMAQAGQYNLPRALRRGDGPAAMLACAEFARAALSFVFLVNRRYMPFYKWAPKLCRELPCLGEALSSTLQDLAGAPLRDERDLQAAAIVEEFCGACASHLRAAGLSQCADSWLWAHGPQIISHVRDEKILALDLLRG